MSAGNKPKGRLPDYKLCVKDMTTEHKAEVGAGWKNENGSISIRLNLCSVIHHNPNLVLTLFPYDRKGMPYAQAADHLLNGEDRSAEVNRQQDVD